MKKQRSNLLKRASALVLALMICVSMLQVSALAADSTCNSGYHNYDLSTVISERPVSGGKMQTFKCQSCDVTTEMFCASSTDTNECVQGDLIETIEPTCNSAGKRVFLCKYGPNHTCGGKIEVPYGQPTGEHTWGPWAITIEPTVDDVGCEERTCTVCRATEQKEIEKKPVCNHNDTDVRVVEEATHEQEGIKELYCKECLKVLETQSCPIIKDHAFQKTNKVVSPTCLKQGYTEYECKYDFCNKTEMRDFTGPNGHTWEETKSGQWLTNGQPTPIVSEQKCSVCGFQGKRVESWCPNVDLTGAKPCHPLEKTVIDATCTKEGKSIYTKCEECGYSLPDEIIANPLGHEYKVNAIDGNDKQHQLECIRGDVTTLEDHDFELIDHSDPTYTSQGHDTMKCKDCGYTVTTYTSLVCEHPENMLIVDEERSNPATCLDKGNTHYICTQCEQMVRSDEIAALGHDHSEEWDIYGDDATGGHRHACTRCDETTDGHFSNDGAHVYSSEITRQPTLAMDGERTYTCDECSHSYTEAVPFTGPRPAPFPPQDEPLPDPDVPLEPTPEEPDEPVDDPDVPLEPTPDIPDEPDEPIDDPDVPLDPTPDIPDEPDEPDEPIDEPDTPLAPEPELPEEPGDNGNGEEEIDDTDVPLSDVPKTGDVPADFFALLAAGCGLALIRTRKNAVK